MKAEQLWLGFNTCPGQFVAKVKSVESGPVKINCWILRSWFPTLLRTTSTKPVISPAGAGGRLTLGGETSRFKPAYAGKENSIVKSMAKRVETQIRIAVHVRREENLNQANPLNGNPYLSGDLEPPSSSLPLLG